MEYSFSPLAILAFLQVLLVIGISIRVIMNRPPSGVALAWLLIVSMIPYLGAGLYLLIGERRISPKRVARLGKLREDFREIAEITVAEGLTDVDWNKHPRDARSMATLGANTADALTFGGNNLELVSEPRTILTRIRQDIDAAKTSVLMEFYIWHEGGLADDVLDSLISAAERGVYCLVLIDALGASAWWKSAQPTRLKESGVLLKPALPVGLFRSLVGRTDLRLHRKIVIIDGETGWTGSMNMVDPGFFKQDSNYGEWVDAMVRIRGTALLSLAAILGGDWVVETGENLRQMGRKAGINIPEASGDSDVQVVASGPGSQGNGLLKMMQAMINNAREEVVITTPYLVPDESLLWALRGATGRGVRVKIIVPATVDSFMTRHASNSYLDGMMNHGIEIYLYQGGLLHTKSIMADGSISMFGTVNFDMRSLWLNHEVSLFIYDSSFAEQLGSLQSEYLKDSKRLDSDEWGSRHVAVKFLENTMRLMSPLL